MGIYLVYNIFRSIYESCIFHKNLIIRNLELQFIKKICRINSKEINNSGPTIYICGRHTDGV